MEGFFVERERGRVRKEGRLQRVVRISKIRADEEGTHVLEIYGSFCAESQDIMRRR